MLTIDITNNPDKSQLEKLGVFLWPVWEKEASEFPWTYDAQEICYLIEGDVTIIPDGEKPVQFGKGDLVIFPAGMSCQWLIHKDVRKHYKFG